MLGVRERLVEGERVPPWLRYQHLARYEWASGFCAEARVLDAACGNGYGSQILSRVARSVTSLDIAWEPVLDAAGSIGSRVLMGDSQRLPFRDASFEIVTSFETIEHVRDDREYVREARRVLAVGGTFLCSTPNRGLVNPGNSIADPPFNPFHVREYRPPELEQLLRESFAEVTILGQTPFSRTYARSLQAVAGMWRMLAVRLHQARKLAGAWREQPSRHVPSAPAAGVELEVIVAVCR